MAPNGWTGPRPFLALGSGFARVQNHHTGQRARRRRRQQLDPHRGVVVRVVHLAQEATDVDAVDEVVVPGRNAADVDRLPLLCGDVDVAPTDGDALEEAQRTRLVPRAVLPLIGCVAGGPSVGSGERWSLVRQKPLLWSRTICAPAKVLSS